MIAHESTRRWAVIDSVSAYRGKIGYGTRIRNSPRRSLDALLAMLKRPAHVGSLNPKILECWGCLRRPRPLLELSALYLLGRLAQKVQNHEAIYIQLQLVRALVSQQVPSICGVRYRLPQARSSGF